VPAEQFRQMREPRGRKVPAVQLAQSVEALPDDDPGGHGMHTPRCDIQGVAEERGRARAVDLAQSWKREPVRVETPPLMRFTRRMLQSLMSTASKASFCQRAAQVMALKLVIAKTSEEQRNGEFFSPAMVVMVVIVLFVILSFFME